MYRWSFLGIKWFMERYWFKVGKNIFDDTWKSIDCSYSYNCSGHALNYLQLEENSFSHNFLIKIVLWNIDWACSWGIYLKELRNCIVCIICMWSLQSLFCSVRVHISLGFRLSVVWFFVFQYLWLLIFSFA